MGDGVKSTSDKLHYYAYSTIKAPDKGEVGGSSPPRPTIFCANVSLFLLKIQCLRGRAKSRPGDALFSNLKAVGSTDQVPMHREPSQEDAGGRHQREFQLGNETNVGEPPNTQSRKSSEATEQDCHARDHVHHHKIFVEG